MKREGSSRFQTYLLPAIIAQSMIMGGGYSTGREIVQYAGRFGPPGWLAVGLIFVGFAVLCAMAFEVARLGKAYDYKKFVRLLIGPLWPLFDVTMLAMALLVIAVMTAAIGSVLLQTLGLPTSLGLLIAVVAVGSLSWFGSGVIERFKTVGSVALYVAYIGFAVWILTGTQEAATSSQVAVATTGAVAISAVQYVGYNLSTIPVVLFCLHRQTRRGEAIGSGLLAGLAMTVPFALTFLCLMRFWPSEKVLGAEVPWLPMLEAASSARGGAGYWVVVFGVVAGWTLLETAVGSIHALVERLEHNLGDLPLFLRPKAGSYSPGHRAAISVGVLLAATVLARFGIIDLVARGYGALSWAFIVLFALPLLVVGGWIIWRGRVVAWPGFGGSA